MEVELVIVGGKQAGREIPVSGPEFLIGRGAECQLQPRSKLISRKHCAIVVEKDSAAIQDFGSTNGTFVNGEKIQGLRELKGGDRVKIGGLEFEVHLAVSPEGKKKPKVPNVQEAAAHTVALAAATNDDLDISGWLEEDLDGQALTPPPKKPPEAHDTVTGKNMVDTVAMPVAPDQQGKKKQPPAKIVGQFQRAAKPMAESSRSAAEDMLKQFFPRKNP